MGEHEKWYDRTGPENDVVISTRIRLARNLKRYPFPARMTEKQRQEVQKEAENAILNSNSAIAKEFSLKNLDDISKTERVSLVERHLVSPEFISVSEGRSVFLTKDESIAIMVNEEDHLRIQVICEGLNFQGALSTADRLDTLLNESLSFAFDEKLGYLTQCPTNLGTGMRASLMLHLPALHDNGTIVRIASNLAKLGLTMRGTYGETSRPIGAIYQLSNQVTLGLSEQEAVDNLSSIATQLIKQERDARKTLSSNIEIQDAVSRAVGLLGSAKLLGSDEFMNLISTVKLGVGAGLIENIKTESINRLIIRTQPATLQLSEGQALSPTQRDALRAKIVRETLTA